MRPLGLQAGCHVRSRTTPANSCHKTEEGLLEALKSSTTERALRETRCPRGARVMMVPAAGPKGNDASCTAHRCSDGPHRVSVEAAGG